MPRVTFVLPDGSERVVDAHDGVSVMRTAVVAGIDAIEGACGGVLSCATCHVLVDPAWTARIPAATPDEIAMLEFTDVPSTSQSRLGCQIELTPALDGLLLRIPATR